MGLASLALPLLFSVAFAAALAPSLFCLSPRHLSLIPSAFRRSVDRLDGPWAVDGLLDALAALGVSAGYPLLTIKAQDLDVRVYTRVLYLFLTSLIFAAPIFGVFYKIAMALAADGAENLAMDVDRAPSGETQQDSGKLPFPSLNADGTIETQYLSISGKRRAELVDLCRQFHIKYSNANMPTIRARLEEFSRDDSQWNNLRSAARRPHLGRPVNTKGVKTAAVLKRSTKRRELMFKDDPAATRKPLTTLGGQQAATGWSAERHKADIEWATRICSQFPYHPEATRLQLAAQDAQSLPPSAAVDMKQGIEHANSRLEMILQRIMATPTPSHKPSTSQAVVHIPSADDNELTEVRPATTSQQLPTPCPAVPCALSSQASAADQPTRSLTLADGQQIVFTADDVPSPPAISFANDIAALNGMWDDTSRFWNKDSRLRIQGVAIPIIYWKSIYTSKPNVDWKPKQWKGLKGKYFEWKVIVERYREGTPDQFWASFSRDDGEHLGYKAILSRLLAERKQKNAELAEQIKAEYGDRFGEVFSYRKNGKVYIKTRPCDIIKQYYKEKGIVLDDDDDGDEGGEEMHA